MSRKNKPSPGVCGHCGRAVVQPTEQYLSVSKVGDSFWVNRHRYEGGRLIEVKCFQHEPREDWDSE